MTSSQFRPTALILDFGGVLTNNLWGVFRDFARSEGLPAESIVDLATKDRIGGRLWHSLERGEIGQTDFDHEMAALLGIDPNGLLQRIAAGLRPDERMLTFLAHARSHGIKTGVLSNSWGSGYFDPYAPWHLNDRVDVAIFSHQVRMRKPDEGIFTLMVEKLSVPATRCVFVDDIAAYLTTPAALGMITVHHTDTNTTLVTLADLFDLTDPTR